MAEFIIVFREVLEASLIIGILYTFLNKTNQHEAIAQLWKGVYLALIASVVGSVLFQKLLGGFTGQAEKLFEGIVMIVAAAVLGTMIIWMAKNKNIAATTMPAIVNFLRLMFSNAFIIFSKTLLLSQ